MSFRPRPIGRIIQRRLARALSVLLIKNPELWETQFLRNEPPSFNHVNQVNTDTIIQNLQTWYSYYEEWNTRFHNGSSPKPEHLCMNVGKFWVDCVQQSEHVQEPRNEDVTRVLVKLNQAIGLIEEDLQTLRHQEQRRVPIMELNERGIVDT